MQSALGLAGRMPGILAARRADLVWITRGLIPGFDEIMRLCGSPLVLDVDDAVWLTEPRGQGAAIRSARRADAMIVGNSFLADWYADHARVVHIIPTAVDCRRFAPSDDEVDRPFTVGWIGTSSNLGQLEDVRGALEQLLSVRKDARLLVVADRAPHWFPAGSPRHVFRPWSRETEIASLQSMDVGIMPLQDSPWTRGKCSFKMLQYMATGLPVVVSPVGMNVEVLRLGDVGCGAADERAWTDALVGLHYDRALCRKLGCTGRSVVEEHFDLPIVSELLAEVFNELAGHGRPAPRSTGP
jgi:glycosyltransferase involved in cell wall biosynthesis